MDIEKFEKLKNIATILTKELNMVLGNYAEDILSVKIDPVFDNIIIETKHYKIKVYVDIDRYNENVTVVEFTAWTSVSKTTLMMLNKIFEAVEKTVKEV